MACCPDQPTPWHTSVFRIAVGATVVESLLFPISLVMLYGFFALLASEHPFPSDTVIVPDLVFALMLSWIATNFAMCGALWTLVCCGCNNSFNADRRSCWAGLGCIATFSAGVACCELASIIIFRWQHYVDVIAGPTVSVYVIIVATAIVPRLFLAAYLCCNWCNQPAAARLYDASRGEEGGIELPVAAIASPLSAQHNPAGTTTAVPYASTVSGGGVPTSWKCATCTYFHENALERTFLACKLCHMPRERDAAATAIADTATAAASNQEEEEPEEGSAAAAALPPPVVPGHVSLQLATFLRCVHGDGVRYRNSPDVRDVCSGGESVRGQEIIEMCTRPGENPEEVAALASGLWVRCATDIGQSKWIPLELDGRPLFVPVAGAPTASDVAVV